MARHSTAQHGTAWYGMVYGICHGMVWYGTVWYVWFMIYGIWHGMAMSWHGMAQHGMVWYGMVSDRNAATETLPLMVRVSEVYSQWRTISKVWCSFP